MIGPAAAVEEDRPGVGAAVYVARSDGVLVRCKQKSRRPTAGARTVSQGTGKSWADWP